MDFDTYRALPAVSISALKELRRSPLHYRHRLQNPMSSPAMTLGTAAHCATLEPDRFSREFAVWDRVTDSGASAPRRGKAWEEFQLQHAGKTILTAAEYATAEAIAQAVRGDFVAFKYVADGEPEVSLEWELDGRPCKGRIDFHTRLDNQPVVVGLKTCRDVRAFQFGSVSARLGYHLQWAFYFDGYCQVTKDVPRMIEIAVESSPPHAVATYVIPDDVIDQGRDEYQELLRVLERCERENNWPGPAETELVLTLPSWVYGSEDDDLSDLGLEA